MSKQAQRWTRKPETRATIRNTISQREFVADARRYGVHRSVTR
jgi:hypothetical protein